MLKLVFGIFFLVQSLNIAAAGNPLACGAAVLDFSFAKGASKAEPTIETILSISLGTRNTTLRYDGTVDLIGAVCIPDRSGAPTFVFQAYCGGSGCHDLDNWGIIDAADLRIKLVPNDWNRADAQKILGRPLPEISPMISIDAEARKLGL